MTKAIKIAYWIYMLISTAWDAVALWVLFTHKIDTLIFTALVVYLVLIVASQGVATYLYRTKVK